jgi:hypothetical protein
MPQVSHDNIPDVLHVEGELPLARLKLKVGLHRLKKLAVRYSRHPISVIVFFRVRFATI